MAVRGGDQCAEADPVWLNDLPKPAGSGGVKPTQETIPTPPAKANEGFKLQPSANSENRSTSPPVAKPELGEGFKLEPNAKENDHSGDESKPAINGLDAIPANPVRPDKPTNFTQDGDSATPATTPSKAPTGTPIAPEPSPTDATPAQPSLLPPSSPQGT
jgi:hypothetical protein